jgi:hypothetical protein
MKAISLTQPWAALVVLGEKGIETRSWPTSVRGRVAIHAAKSFPMLARHACLVSPFKEVLAQHGFSSPKDLEGTFGAIIGSAELVECRRFTGDRDEVLREAAKTYESAFGDFSIGRYGFVLKDAWPCKHYPIRGALGFWDVPDEAVRHIEETSLRVSDGFKLV